MSEHWSALGLAREWRTRAEELRGYGAQPQAVVLEKCAEELEHSASEWQAEPLTLGEAAEMSGYSTDHLGRLVRTGAIPNAGRPGVPRIRRADLPIKAHPTPLPMAEEPVSSEDSLGQIVRSIIDEGVA